jgi:hypothetical protein
MSGTRLIINCADNGEKETLERFLSSLRMLTTDELVEKTKLMVNEVMTVEDILRKSGF